MTSDLPRLLQRDTSSRRITAALGPRTDGSGPPCVSADKASHGGAAAAGADQPRVHQTEKSLSDFRETEKRNIISLIYKTELKFTLVFIQKITIVSEDY